MQIRKINIPIFISHQGCPNDCIFCNQKRITGVYQKEKQEEIKEKIGSFLKTAPLNCEIEISFFGGSFTGIEFGEQNLYLTIANSFFYDKRITGIRLSTRPDYIDDVILSNLKAKNVKTIELGVQSMDDEVLRLNKRGLNRQAVFDAVKKIKEYSFSLGLQMMTGMFGSNEQKDIETAKELILLKPDFVRIYPTVVIKDTELFSLFKEGKYQPQSIEQSVKLCATLYEMFEENNIKVIRMGLMSGEEINEQNVIGPYHSSFGEQVLSYLYYMKIKEKLIGKETENKNLFIYDQKKNVSKIIGNKKSNILKLKEEFNFREIKVIEKDAQNFSIEIQ